MPVEVKDKYRFSVDTWSSQSKRKKHHFLTHAHSDHTAGIKSFDGRRIYCTEITRLLLLRRFPELKSVQFLILEIGATKMVEDGDESDGEESFPEESFTVTAFDANHCPGAVMLLFEGSFGNVLHTGDCRLTDDCLKNVMGKYKTQQCVLDCVFLDCTFGKERMRMPSKEEAFYQVQQCILNHPKAPTVYLACDMLGHEGLLSNLVTYFRSKIYVDKDLQPEYYADMALVIPELLTEDPQSTRFHICKAFPKLYERAKIKFMQAHRLKQEEPLFIRPSAQWYTLEERLEDAICGMIPGVALKRPTAQRFRTCPAPKAAEKDQYGIWHVCYSMHSSRSELERALETLWPKEVISTTPHCHAREVMSDRRGLYQIDEVDLPKVATPNLSQEATTSSGRKATDGTLYEGGSQVFFPRSRTSSSPSKRLLSNLEGDCGGGALNNVVQLFGSARYRIPSSPPMSFSSADSDEDVEFFDSQSTDLYYSNEGGDGTANQSKVEGKSPHPKLDHVDVVDGAEVTSAFPVDKPDQTGTILRERSERSSCTYYPHLREGTDCVDQSGVETELTTLGTAGHIISCRKKRSGGVAVLEESTRKLYRSLRVPIPAPLPSLLDLYNFDL